MYVQLLNDKPALTKHNFNVLFIDEKKVSKSKALSNNEVDYIRLKIEAKQNIIPLYNGKLTNWVIITPSEDKTNESYRVLGADFAKQAQKEKATEINVEGSNINPEELLAFAEGFVLESYRFLKYFKSETKSEKLFTVKQLNVFHSKLSNAQISFLNNTLKAVFWARDMVNEPVNFMNAVRFSQEVVLRGQEAGFTVEVFDKKKISSLRMGGLLAVNKGSIDPPTFTVCEWKPKNAVNKRPYVLVGKGVMYDTGGLSLKPTPNSMDLMKSDMGGAAAVAASIYSVALNNLPIWIVGLLPATDNRPDGNAYVPGDIIKMYNGLHVEVLNTDAEGRLLLADGLSYGDKYEPELLMSVATLTGSASMAIGTHAAIFMGNAKTTWFNRFIESGTNTNERLVQFPFWKEYGESLKSNIADLKNLGGREGGAISAGKFLENFTDSPYLHFDIAGTAFLTTDEKYKPKGGTGFGVRLFTEFFKNISQSADKK